MRPRNRPALPRWLRLPRKPRPDPATDDAQVLASLFGSPAMPPAARPARSPASAATGARRKRRMDRGDVTLAVSGVVLAATCALFPWYIFFNQEKFGVREFVFSGQGTARSAPGFGYQPQHAARPFASAEVPKLELDLFPTATVPAGQEPVRAVPASEQPFPADRVPFRLVHVANGRAMIEDRDGLWVVQRGSRLPDASHVAAIEQRHGRWVLVTTRDAVVELVH